MLPLANRFILNHFSTTRLACQSSRLRWQHLLRSSNVSLGLRSVASTMSSTSPSAAERELAIRAVLLASSLCQKVFRSLVLPSLSQTKVDKSPVTVADYGAQALVNHLIHNQFPEDPIVGEEDSSDLQKDDKLTQNVVNLTNEALKEAGEPALSKEDILRSIDLGQYEGGSKGRFWTLDPIDGTKGFLRGEQFAVCLALIVDGVVQLGVIGCPNLPSADDADNEGKRGALFIAVKGHGAYTRSLDDPALSPVHVSATVDTPSAKFCESVESGHSSQSDSARIAQLLNITADPVRMDSQCKYGVISRGQADIYLRLPVSETYQEKIWDHASGNLVVTEAGGKVTDIFGKELDFSQGRTLKTNKGVIATNGQLHAKVMAAVAEVLKVHSA
ncbi:hypothetical protein BC832DRAFT_567927 [Gaertneriomyces semiglobifer]|nr:hypothetical protein BC832DRAFT_567927 [Gaertneriomyces semiglobifer]